MSELSTRLKEESKVTTNVQLTNKMKGKNHKNIVNMTQKVNSGSFGSSETLLEAVIEVDVHQNAQDNNFILNKFLNDTNSLSSKSPKRPIPLPRKSKQDAVSSVDDSSTNRSENIEIQSSTPSSAKLKAQSSKETAILIESSDDERITEKELDNSDLRECDVSKPNDGAYTYNKLMAITVHKTDRLLLDSLVVHPLVKVHIVDMSSGNYILKSDNNRAVVFYYENKGVEYITPLLCKSYDLHSNRSVCPEWEEMLLINEDMTYILEQGVIIFFELIDFVSFSVANSQSKPEGWHKIAWGFLKPLGKNEELNINKKVRLQLYQPHKYKKCSSNVCPIFHWWKKKWIKYPSSLYVSVCEIEPPESTTRTLRSKTPIQPERGSSETLETVPDHRRNSQLSNEITSTKKQDQKLWSRLNYQTCKLPNRRIAELPSFKEGCFVMNFSHDGLHFACAVQIDAMYFIMLYSVKSLEEMYRYPAHQGMIYNINWSADDRYIVSCSADCTVGIWNFEQRSFIEMLPHPSFVYASAVDRNNTIATGCYDYTVRIWGLSSKTYDLLQELDGHKGYVTSLCFMSNHHCLYSSDSVGVVIEWRRGEDSQHLWSFSRKYKWIDLKDTIINQILLHKRERRLLIHARDSTIRLVDLKTGCTLQWLQGETNNRFRTICCFSPCGTYIFAGGESGTVSVWNADLGDLVATYEPFNKQTVMIHCVQFHPHDNILAISHYGHNVPILIAVFDHTINGESNIGLKILERDDEVRVVHTQDRTKTEIVKKKLNIAAAKGRRINLESVMEKINQIMETPAS